MTHDTTPPKRIWEFDRYINGVLMAEGVSIEKQPDLASAMKAAAIIASRGPHGEVPVLIVREDASEHAALIREAEARGRIAGLDEAEKIAAGVAGNTKAFNADRRRGAGEVQAAIRAAKATP